MNSTKENRVKIIQEFFNQQVMPLSKQLHSKEQPLMPLAPETKAETYYISRSQTSTNRQDFEAPAVSNERELEKALREQWNHSPEFANLAQPSANIAQKLAETEEQTEEVSPFTYIMF